MKYATPSGFIAEIVLDFYNHATPMGFKNMDNIQGGCNPVLSSILLPLTLQPRRGGMIIENQTVVARKP